MVFETNKSIWSLISKWRPMAIYIFQIQDTGLMIACIANKLELFAQSYIVKNTGIFIYYTVYGITEFYLLL